MIWWQTLDAPLSDYRNLPAATFDSGHALNASSNDVLGAGSLVAQRFCSIVCLQWAFLGSISLWEGRYSKL